MSLSICRGFESHLRPVKNLLLIHLKQPHLQALSCLVRTLRALVEWYMHTAPHMAAPDAAVAPPHAEDGVQKDWNQLQSLPSGPLEQPQRSSATGEAPGMQ